MLPGTVDWTSETYTLYNWKKPSELSRVCVYSYQKLQIAWELKQLTRYTDRAAGWTIWGSNAGIGKRFSFPQKPPNQLWGPPNPLLNGWRGSSSGRTDLSVKLTTHFHVIPKVQNEWSYISTPHTSSWCGQGQIFICLSLILLKKFWSWRLHLCRSALRLVGQEPEPSGDWYDSGMLLPGQSLRGRLPLLS